MRDITERKQAEETLGKQGELLRSILDNMGDAVLVADLHKRIVLFNPAAERIFGAGLLKGDFQLFLPDRATLLAELPLAHCIAGKSFDQLELFVRHGGAAHGRWVSLTGRPLREKNGVIQGAVLVCHDITARKLAEKRLAAQYLVARTLGQIDGSPEETAKELLTELGDSLDFDAAAWWSVDGSALTCQAVWHGPDDSLADFLAETRTCVLAGTPELPTEVIAEARPRVYPVQPNPWSGSPRWAMAQREGLHHVLAFPA